jgi:hypothetical protein
MIRRGAVVLGVALAALAGFGLWADRSAVMLWFDLVAAILAFGVAALEREDELGATRGWGPAAIGLGLGALWIAGLTSGQPRWAVWANFLFACAFLALAVMGAAEGRRAATAVAHRRRR